MKKRKKQSSTDEVDIVETAHVLRIQQGWSVGKIATSRGHAWNGIAVTWIDPATCPWQVMRGGWGMA